MGVEPIRQRERGLRVLLATDTVGGVWPFSLELAEWLVRRGDHVLLAAMGREPDATQRRQADAIEGLSWCAGPHKLVWMEDPWHDLDAAAAWLQGLAVECGADVVHLNDLALADRDWPAPVLLTAHSCVCSWWEAVHGDAVPSDWDRYRACVARSVAAADAVVAPTDAMLEALVRHHGPARAAHVIHNGRTPPPAAAVPKEPIVLSAGRFWDPAKNLQALGAVAPRLPWPVYVAGERLAPGATGADGAGDALRPLGQLPEPALRAWMARAAIYALPARYEPFGLSALEAAQAGCALVLGDLPSLREVWGESALFVPPDDHAALESALRRLIDDASLRKAMARRARVRARRYAPDAMAASYRDAYVGIIARRAVMARREPLVAAAGARA